MLKTKVANFGTFRTAFAAGAGIIVVMASSVFAQEPTPTPAGSAPTARAFDANGNPLPNPEVTTERIIVTARTFPPLKKSDRTRS